MVHEDTKLVSQSQYSHMKAGMPVAEMPRPHGIIYIAESSNVSSSYMRQKLEGKYGF